MHPFLLTKLGEDDIVSVTPYHDQNGRRIMIYRFGNWRPSKIPINEIFRATLILFEMGALEPQSQVLGGVGEFAFGQSFLIKYSKSNADNEKIMFF